MNARQMAKYGINLLSSDFDIYQYLSVFTTGENVYDICCRSPRLWHWRAA